MSKENNGLRFVSVDSITGERKDGYIDKNGEMKFKKQPWYKRIFHKPPSKIEAIGTTQFSHSYIWSNKERCVVYPVYRKFNSYTNETYSIYSNIEDHGAFYFNVELFEKTGKLVRR